MTVMTVGELPPHLPEGLQRTVIRHGVTSYASQSSAATDSEWIDSANISHRE